MRKLIHGSAVLFSIAMLAGPAGAQTAYGLSGSDRLVTFEAATPGAITSDRAIVGLLPGEVLTGIDIRPANNTIYSVGVSGNLYSLAESGGVYVATMVAPLTNSMGGGPVPVIGSNFGIDFNPVPDRLRFITDSDQNLRINPDNGVTIIDGAINPPTFNLIGSAYINNFAGTTATTLYGIDSLTASLARSTNANAGSYVTVGLLGLGPIASDARVGFDVYTDFTGNNAYLALNDSLYTVNLASGSATLVGGIGAPNIRGLTFALAGAVPEPATWAMMICGFGFIGAALRRRRKAVAAFV